MLPLSRRREVTPGEPRATEGEGQFVQRVHSGGEVYLSLSSELSAITRASIT